MFCVKAKFGFHARYLSKEKCPYVSIVKFTNRLCRGVNQFFAATDVEVERPEEKFVRRNRHRLRGENEFIAGQIQFELHVRFCGQWLKTLIVVHENVAAGAVRTHGPDRKSTR